MEKRRIDGELAVNVLSRAIEAATGESVTAGH